MTPKQLTHLSPHFPFRVFDPHEWLEPSSISLAESAGACPILADRLDVLHQRHSARGTSAKVVIHDSAIAWWHESSSSPNIEVLFEGQTLHESPQMALVGAISVLFFEELTRTYRPSWDALLDEQTQATKNIAGAPDDDATRRNEIAEIFRLRATWHSKYEFYSEIRTREKEYDPGDLWFQGAWDTEKQNGTPGLETAIRTAFKRQFPYSPGLVDAIWIVPLPPRWELSISAPTTLLFLPDLRS